MYPWRGAGGLDLARMFPSLKLDRIVCAHRELAARYAKMRDLHRATKGRGSWDDIFTSNGSFWDPWGRPSPISYKHQPP